MTKSPAKLRPRVNLAVAYQRKGDYENAIREYRNAELLSYDPKQLDGVEARSRIAEALGTMLINRGHYREAGEILVKDWNENQGFPAVGHKLSEVLLHDNRPDLAELVLTRTIDGLPEYPWFRFEGYLFLNRSIARAQMGKCAESKRDFQEVLKDPDLRHLNVPPPCIERTP